LNYLELEKYDPTGMFKIYDDWPSIAQKSYDNEYEKMSFTKTDHIVLCGMGGSGSVCDVISAILSKTSIHVSVVKGYLLPKTVNSKSLVISISVSGNTIETLTTLDSANKLGCQIISLSSGGKIHQFCKNNNIKHILLQQYHSPRASFTSFLYGTLKILNSILPIEINDINESINQLKIRSKQICSSNLTDTNISLNLAKWISDFPTIYYPWGLESSAIRFKNSLNENTKCIAVIEDVIEACHNNIVSFTRFPKNKVVLLEGTDDYVKTKERWNIVKEYFQINNIDFMEIHSTNGSILSKLVDLIYLLDYSTIFRAVLSKIDPSPVKPIDFIKKRI
jgi:glucose/mannose-6-phosphate isomerase